MAEFQIVDCGKGAKREGTRIIAHAIHVVHGGHSFDFIDDLLGVGFASALQVGVDEEVHGMELVAFSSHVQGGGLAGGGDGGGSSP